MAMSTGLESGTRMRHQIAQLERRRCGRFVKVLGMVK